MGSRTAERGRNGEAGGRWPRQSLDRMNLEKRFNCEKSYGGKELETAHSPGGCWEAWQAERFPPVAGQRFSAKNKLL